MKPQTCCCHVCKTSLNQYRREYLPCTQCNKIVCKNCFGTKWRGSTWAEAVLTRDRWICPSCSGTCTCPRCKARKLNSTGKLGVAHEDMKSHNHHHHTNRNGFHIGETNGKICDSYNSGSEQHSPPLCLDDLKPDVQKVVVEQLEELLHSERRCDQNIRAMERMLSLMKKEKEQLSTQRIKLEMMARAKDQSPSSSPTSEPDGTSCSEADESTTTTTQGGINSGREISLVA